MRQILDKLQRAKEQSNWWAFAAVTAPFVALTIIIGERVFGLESFEDIISIIITVTFVAVSVFWWWWALSKIRLVVEALKIQEENFKDLKDELVSTNREIREGHANYRKRRKP